MKTNVFRHQGKISITKFFTTLIFYSLALILVSSCNQGVDQKETLTHQRHIALDGEPNFRDIGGYITTDGKTVKWGQVYRSGKLSKLSDDDVKILDSLNIQTVVNFLNATELEHDGEDRLPERVKTVSNPVDVDGDWAIVALEARKNGDFSLVSIELNPEFHRMLTNEAMEQYAILFHEILYEENRPIVFHCSHGIHRTGTGAAILLWILGVPWKTIQEDYLLSNTYREAQIEKRLGQLKTLAAKNQGIPEVEVDMTNARAFYVLEDFYIDAVREEVLNKYGSVEKYVTEGLGFTESDIKKLRKELLK